MTNRQIKLAVKKNKQTFRMSKWPDKEQPQSRGQKSHIPNCQHSCRINEGSARQLRK